MPPTTSFPPTAALPHSPAGLLCSSRCAFPALPRLPSLAELCSWLFCAFPDFQLFPFLERANFYQHHKYFPRSLFKYKQSRETIKTKNLFCRVLILTDLKMDLRAEPFVTHISLQDLRIGLLCIAQAKANKVSFKNFFIYNTCSTRAPHKSLEPVFCLLE